MIDLRNYLGLDPEILPAWLQNYDTLNRAEIVSSFLNYRTIFYPGSGSDGSPVACFNSAHAAHCYIYVDYLLTDNDLRRELDRGFLGYRSLSTIGLRARDLIPLGWRPTPGLPRREMWITPVAPFGFLEIFERIDGYDNSHGSSRFAILFLGADGFAAFDALFCQANGFQPPYCVVLQDHGFGCNYDDFGGGGFLEGLALSRCRPHYLLVAENTRPWEGYQPVRSVLPDPNRQRRLYAASV